MEKARWSPDLKYNIYKKAVIHFRKHQYALASVVAQQRDDSHIMKLIQSKGENTDEKEIFMTYKMYNSNI